MKSEASVVIVRQLCEVRGLCSHDMSTDSFVKSEGSVVMAVETRDDVHMTARDVTHLLLPWHARSRSPSVTDPVSLCGGRRR